MASVCQTCGDPGYDELLLHCEACNVMAVHRYCVGITPVPYTQDITWICEDCAGTDKAKRILKKINKTKKQKSGNQILPVLADDHGLQDATNVEHSGNNTPLVLADDQGLQNATNVEPMEVSSSSPIKQTMESKRQQRSDSKKPHESTVLDGNVASVSEAEHSPSMPDHNYCTTREEKLSSGNIPHTEHRQLSDGNSSSEKGDSNMPQTTECLTSRKYIAQPIETPKWRGLISVKGKNSCNIDGVVAHVSNLACPRVHDTASLLPCSLSAEMFPRSEIWPKSFEKSGGAKDDSIALFFFPLNESPDKKVFYSLVGEMKDNDLAMKCVLDKAELLLFTSDILPIGSWTFNSTLYLWGVFKRRQTSRQ